MPLNLIQGKQLNVNLTGSFTGSFSGSFDGTGSYAINALTASYLSGYVSPFPYTGSALITGSLGITGSLNVTQGITGSLFGTASFASTASFVPGYISGSGTSGQVAFFNGTNSQIGDNGLFWDNTNKRLGVGTTSPTARLHIEGVNTINSIFAKNHAGFQAFVVNNQGNTSIGLNADSSAMLNVKGAGNTSATFALGVVNDSRVNMFNVRNDGNVGVGMATPAARLDVRAQGALSTDIAFRVRNSADTANLLELNGLGVTTINAVNENVQLRLTNTGTANNRSAIAFQFNNSGVDQAMIRALPGIIVGSYGRFAISTYNIFGGGMVDRMLFDEFGGVSIGSSYAQNVAIPARLDVRAQGALSTDIAFRVRNSADTFDIVQVRGDGVTNFNLATGQNVSFTHAGGTRLNLDGISIAYRTGNRVYLGGGNDFLDFFTANSNRMTISSTGNVGIGTTIPNAKLDVNGNAIVTGSLTVTQGITGSLFGTASQAISASWAPFQVSSSYALSSSYAETASFAPSYLPLTGGTIDGNVIVNGTASIAFLNVQYESASVIYSSGSNIFGDATDDVQTLNGTVIVSGSQQITGSLNVSGPLTAQSIIKSGGTNLQFLKADGSVDSASYDSSLRINDIANFNVNEPASPTTGDSYISSPILSSTNRVLTSEINDVSFWNYNNAVTVLTNNILSPTGTLTAEKWIATVASTSHTMQVSSPAGQFTPLQLVTVSGFVKAGEYDRITIGGNDSSERATFNLTTQTVSSVGVYVERTQIIPSTDGWYRCSISFRFINPIGNGLLYGGFILVNNSGATFFAGDGTSGIYIWGTQIQQSRLTTYIPTSGTAVTANYTLSGSITTGTSFINNYVYTWNGSSWVEKIPTTGSNAYNSFDKSYYYFNGTSWIQNNSWKYTSSGDIYFTGNVGINQFTPATALDVGGTVRAHGVNGGSAYVEMGQSSNSPYIASNLNGLSITAGGGRLGLNSAVNTNVITSVTGTGEVVFNTAGTERLRILANGNIAIGATTAGARLDVRAQGALSTDIAFRVRNSADTANLFNVNGDGSFRFNNSGVVAGVLTVNQTFEAASAFNFIGGTGSTGGKTLRIGSTGGLGVDGATTNNFFAGYLKVGSGAAVDSSAVLEAVSTTKGFLPPRMTNAQRLAIASPAEGLVVYTTGSSNDGLNYYNSGSQIGWHKVLTDTGSQQITGSLTVTQGITGSLFGTSSYAVTASYVLNGGSNTIINDSVPAVVDGGTWYQPASGSFCVGITGSWVTVGRDGANGADGAPGGANDGTVSYIAIASDLVSRIETSTGTWDFSEAGIIDATINSNTSASFDNLQLNKTLKVKIMISGSSALSFPSYCKPTVGSVNPSGTNGTYYAYFDCWNDTSGSEVVLQSIVQLA